MAQNDYRAGPVERAAALAVHASFLEVYPPPEHLSDLLAGRLYAEPEFPYLNLPYMFFRICSSVLSQGLANTVWYGR